MSTCVAYSVLCIRSDYHSVIMSDVEYFDDATGVTSPSLFPQDKVVWEEDSRLSETDGQVLTPVSAGELSGLAETLKTLIADVKDMKNDIAFLKDKAFGEKSKAAPRQINGIPSSQPSAKIMKVAPQPSTSSDQDVTDQAVRQLTGNLEQGMSDDSSDEEGVFNEIFEFFANNKYFPTDS